MRVVLYKCDCLLPCCWRGLILIRWGFGVGCAGGDCFTVLGGGGSSVEVETRDFDVRIMCREGHGAVRGRSR